MHSNPNWDDVMRFSLKENPIIFDVGGYEGTWSSMVLEKYKDCTLYIFEPVKEFCDLIKSKFSNNNNVHVMNFGLSNFSGKSKFFINGDSSSLLQKSGNEVEVDLVDIVSFMQDKGIETVDLIKLNIEGAEYDLLEHMLSRPEMLFVQNLMVQFHSHVPNCVERRKHIQEKLSLHHEKIYDFEFIFEGWVRKQVVLTNTYCIGDSHISIFTSKNDILFPMETGTFENFTAINVGPVLAFTVMDKGNIFELIKNISPGTNLLVCFGEIDCRAQIHRRCVDGNYVEVIREVVNRYFEAILNMKSHIPQESQIILFSVTPELKEEPHWYYYGSNREVFDAPHGTLTERRTYKETFNSMIKQKSLENGIKYISIYDWIMDSGMSMERYYLDDIHLHPMKVKNMIRKAFIDNGVYK